MYISHKIRLEPTKDQIKYMRKACDISRFVYNWGLAEWNKAFESGRDIKANDFVNELDKEFNKIKRANFPWVVEVSKEIQQRSLYELKEAFRNFFRKTSPHPKFKKKNRDRDSFYVANYKFKITDDKVWIPRLGWVKLSESLRFKGKIMGSYVSRTANQWFISVTMNIEVNPEVRENQATIGVDLGISSFATLSDGSKFVMPVSIMRTLRKIDKLYKHMSRMECYSNNWEKMRLKISKEYAKTTNIRSDYIHKLTTKLAKEYDIISIEKLGIEDMAKNHYLAESIYNAGWGIFKNQMEYKTKLYGSTLFVADRYFPSTKTCNVCGNKKNMPLRKRVYKCDKCGMVMDRDLNAAINLEKLAERTINTPGCGGIEACGDVVRPSYVSMAASIKQESEKSEQQNPFWRNTHPLDESVGF